MWWLVGIVGCGVLTGDKTLAVEQPTSGVEYTWMVQRDVPLFASWELSGTPRVCTVPAKATVTVNRQMRVIRSPTHYELEAKRTLLGTDYGAVEELSAAAMRKGQALNYELAAGTPLVLYGEHPEGRGCLMRLPDSRLISAACIPNTPPVQHVQIVSEVTCEGLTGWIGEPS